MGEIILIKESSKQYTKFYISSADIEALFRRQSSEQQSSSQNESLSLSESYEVLYSKKASEPKIRQRYSQNTNLRENLRRNKS